MKNIFTLLLLVVSIIVNAQNQLIIEVTTDKYSDETTWVLYDLNKNVIAENGTLENETTHKDTVILDPAVCYFWTIYDDYSDGMSASEDLGDYKLYLDNVLIGECADNNFGDSISVYGIGSVCSKNDVVVDELTFSTDQTFTPFSVSANIINMGSEIITSVEVLYILDGVESDPTTINDLNIIVGGMQNIAYPEMLELKTAGDYNIGFKVTKVNNAIDENEDNNSIQQIVNVAFGYLKIPLHELFTSSTCGPCVQGNVTLDGVLENYDSTSYSLLKYQANFPGSGDPYYTIDVGRMMTQYSITGVPTLYVELEGQTPHDYTAEKFDGYSDKLTSIGIKLSAQAFGDSVFVDVQLESTLTQQSNHIRLAVVEKTTYGNTGSNGEKEFHNVFMKFLSEWDGDNLSIMNAGEEVSLTYAASMEDTFVEEMDDLMVVAYVFKNSPYEVLQSKMIEIPHTPAAPIIGFNIENDSVGVDTSSSIIITSNENLALLDGNDISDISDIITFKKQDSNGDDVSFTGDYNNTTKTITVKSDNSLEANSKYFVELHNVKSTYGIEVEKTNISFITMQVIGVKDNLFTDISIYPNPVKNELSISLKHNAKITICDITGKHIKTLYKAKPGIRVINVSNFESGIYFITISRGTQNNTYKFIKQ